MSGKYWDIENFTDGEFHLISFYIPSSYSGFLLVKSRISEDAMPLIPEETRPPLFDFMKQCFTKDLLQRPSAERLCEHKWLNVGRV